MKRKTTFKIITISIGFFFGLLLAEMAYRVFHFISYHDLKDIATGNRQPVVRSNEKLNLGQIIQISANRRIVYELIPSSKYLFQNVLVQTNSLGYRDQKYQPMKAKNKRRIVGLGDSVMFGWGVDEGACYLTQLENRLNQQDSVVYEIINTGVPGYNTVMEVATLEYKFALDEIDMVVLNYIGNDWHLPNFLRKKPNYFSIEKSLMLERFNGNDGMDANLESAPMNKFESHYANTIDRTPPEYYDMVGVEAYTAAMEHLGQLRDKYGFMVLVLATNPEAIADDFVYNACEKFGFELVDFYPIWKSYIAENPDAEYSLSLKDMHPSAASHGMIAGVLERPLLELLYSDKQ